jgi:hypothetical protein
MKLSERMKDTTKDNEVEEKDYYSCEEGDEMDVMGMYKMLEGEDKQLVDTLIKKLCYSGEKESE